MSKSKTIQQNINLVPQGETRAKLNQIAYALEMLAISISEGRADADEWRDALLCYAQNVKTTK